ncbi:amino acid ABC transporter permease [Rhizobium bangladeshense]|uniref:Amino acid ABC transporter permease n=1 Tax=Rhizobium bangladeshense TaxID=1138189 RepID=A0ABS7LHR3_9HYPH|nr:amino acid ABC transporter permease [Rhizobium bangladeshense]MBX4872737.1 amino acid ABC transporter permease [Rhizobium bangladeshense]MBX4884116.1 amino acid ABC transporter permease [Rhizobium bangladeshense]MBX4901686.1 amino acid ABC transporter permease [Rhizobium bangladeshense]MBX4913524.1 amino acid ABC transporter permease [Rhizobium bangladeshense]MBY3590824.1 amino acid ABC transporter permease [Rhizobium bangladeshense]
MTHQALDSTRLSRGGWSFQSALYDPTIRGIFFQVLTIVLLVVFVWWVAHNTAVNLARANIASGFGFLNGRAGFEVGQSLIAYSSDSTYGRALVVGLLNTILIAVTGIITATIIGFIIGIGRLSRNWLIAKLCTVYVEVFRNIPPLLVIFFWYSGVLAILPSARESLHLPLGSYLNNRGLAFPKPIFGETFWLVGVAFIVAIIAVIAMARWAHRRQAATGQPFHTIWASIGLLIGLPIIAFLLAGAPLSFDYPVAGKFNLTGGSVVGPEFMSLFLALSFYTAAFIAEIVRAGIRGVPKGQTEAAAALGLHPSSITRLVVIPQAFRIIIPPLSSQYLNLTKNSSLAIAIGFADLVAVGSTTLNQTGQAVEVILIWMVIYLGLSIVTSLFMNWFNAKMALVER